MCFCICLMHMCFPFQKKTSSRFLSVCSAFSASNSLHIIQLIPCKSLWDIFNLVSWGDNCFLCDELGSTDFLFSVQPKTFGTTEAYHSVPPISHQENRLPHILCLFWSSSTQWILSSTSITFLTLLCTVSQGSNPSWKLMSKGEREITSKLLIT